FYVMVVGALSTTFLYATLFRSPKILVGNFIGDFVRGDIASRFEPEIVQGIYLHREIDDFTDSHPSVKAAQELLKPQFGRYALVIDRKSTRLNSSHVKISYAVFC